MKVHLLIVEDEAVLYERLRSKLVKQHYTVADYTPSVKDAIANINLKRPDLVLLDINLEGEQTGFDLGEMLYNTYKIPFIYVTQYDDDHTFHKGLHTNHSDFVVKTKPRLDTKELVRKIETVLHLSKIKDIPNKEGLMGLVGYLDELKDFGKNSITKIPVAYNEIAFFSIKPFVNQNNNLEKLRTNYLWFLTKDKEYYFLKSSLKDLQKHLPYYFVRINESCIVNISPKFLEGRINGSRLSIIGQEFTIKSTYANEFKRITDKLYHS